MNAVIKTKSGPLEIAADESGIVPGVVRVKLGEGFLSMTLYLSPYEAAQIGLKAVEASRCAADAKLREEAAK